MSILAGMSSRFKHLDYQKYIDTIGLIETNNKSFSFVHDNLATLGLSNPKDEIVSYKGYYMIKKGRITNYCEIVEYLKEKGIKSNSDNCLVDLFISEGIKGFKMVDGPFLVAIMKDNKIIIIKDQLGMCSLFYTLEGDLYFSSDINFLIKYLGIKTINLSGICELLGMSPSHSHGKTVYKNIYRLEAGCALIYDGDVQIEKYYDINDVIINDSYENTKRRIYGILKQGITSTTNYSAFISGGLDSTIIASFLEKGTKTYSLDYQDNSFVENDFQVSSDIDYIDYVIDEYELKNEIKQLGNTELISLLESAVIARGYPAMADIDASLLWLINQTEEETIYTGECSDEIFSGYPWCYKECDLSFFPWMRNLDKRLSIVKEEYQSEVKKYVYEEFNKIKRIDDDYRFINYLNLNYFLPNLLERQEKMGDYANRELISPFGSIRLAEIMYNTPKEDAFCLNGEFYEKGLLRSVFLGQIPEEILYRKKSPFPKTHNKEYAKIMREKMINIKEDKTSILQRLIDFDALLNLDDMDIPWYGQLMTIPQLYAFLYQVDFWGREYNIEIEE